MSIPIDPRMTGLGSRGHVAEMRARIASAPIYFADRPEQSAEAISYRYGMWPATDRYDGLVLAEEIVPPNGVDVVDEHTPNGNKFMLAELLVGRPGLGLTDSFAKLGFTGAREIIDEHDSGLISVRFPYVDTFNKTLRETGVEGITVIDSELGRPSEDIVRSYVRDGQLPLTTDYSMILNGPFWGPLPNSVHRALRYKGALALQEKDTKTIQSMVDNLCVRSLQKHSKTLTAAIDDGWVGVVYPDAVDKLGHSLRAQTDYENEISEDKGRALAEDTVKRIEELSAK